jgi:hypothetical protein
VIGVCRATGEQENKRKGSTFLLKVVRRWREGGRGREIIG